MANSQSYALILFLLLSAIFKFFPIKLGYCKVDTDINNYAKNERSNNMVGIKAAALNAVKLNKIYNKSIFAFFSLLITMQKITAFKK